MPDVPPQTFARNKPFYPLVTTDGLLTVLGLSNFLSAFLRVGRK